MVVEGKDISCEKDLVEYDEKLLEIKLYRKRWIIAGIFALYSAASASQWVQYSIITNIIMKYYGVTSLAVDWTSLIAMITYPPLIIPASYMIDKAGLRFCALFGVIGTAAGTWIKLFSVQPHLFWVGFLGQTVVFASQIFILSLAPKIAAVWFGPNELSTACAIGVFGTQAGTALSFILSPNIVKNHDDLEKIGQELSYLFYGICAFATPLVILVYVFFKAEPPLPPSKAQAQLRLNKIEFNSREFLKSYKSLLTNKPFLMLSLCYGINIGVFASVGTLLNQFILAYFANAEKDAGAIGLLLVVIGMFGVMVFGIVLDKTKKFKQTTITLHMMTIIGIVGFMVALETYNKVLVYISACILGFFQNAYYAVGFEFGVELSYPQPESSSSGILVSTSQIFGVIFTLLTGQIMGIFGTLWALILMAFCLLIAGVLTIFIPNKLLRQEALGLKSERESFLRKSQS